MAGFKDSSTTVFKVDDSGGTLRTLTAYVDNVQGLPGDIPLNPSTMLADAGQRFIRSVPGPTFSVNGGWDSTATIGPDVVLGGLITGQTSTASFEYHPEGTGTGAPKYTGECWITSYQVTSQVGARINYTANFQVDGLVTRGVN